MDKALLIKECRENLWLGGIAMAVLLFDLAFQTGWDDDWVSYGWLVWRLEESSAFRYSIAEMPFIYDGFSRAVPGIAALLAIALGFRQTLGESLQGTYMLLFHLPMARWRLVGVKLLMGLCIYSAATAIPVLLFAFWAASPGTHPTPFYWSMTIPTWQALIFVTPVYPAAFLCGVRASRWFGSRLLPLVVVGPSAFLFPVAPIPWWLALSNTLAVNAVLLVCIGYVVRVRDFD